MNPSRRYATPLLAGLLMACCALPLAQAKDAPATSEASSPATREGNLQIEADIADAGQKSSLQARIAAPGTIGFTEGSRRYVLSVNPIDGNSFRITYSASPLPGAGGEKQALGYTDGALIAELGKKVQVEISNGFKLNLLLSR